MASEEEEFPWWGLWNKGGDENSPAEEPGNGDVASEDAQADEALDPTPEATQATIQTEVEEIVIEDAPEDEEDEDYAWEDYLEVGEDVSIEMSAAADVEGDLQQDEEAEAEVALEEADDLAGDIDEFLEGGADEGAPETEDAVADFEEDKPSEGHEDALLVRLRRDFKKLWPKANSIELEPFGSFVTGLGIHDAKSRSDLDVVLMFRGSPADNFGNDVRDTIVSPTINRLGTWLGNQSGITVNNVIRKARVPIVIFETKELSVDISVQQPFGPLNSWHLRDLCESGWPGRLRGLVRLVKSWAKSKSIHTAKDGALSSYGWTMLATSYLQECGVTPALLPKTDGTKSPYLDSDEALVQVLDACSSGAKTGARQCKAWSKPKPSQVDLTSEYAAFSAEDFFAGWIDWMSGQVLGFLQQDESGDCGRMAVENRHIVSVRPRSQEELRSDISWSPKFKEHWSPSGNAVFLLIEEPLNGENVARCVREEGFWAIHAEVKRAQEFLESVTCQKAGFKALLKLPALSTRATFENKANWNGQGGLKRAWSPWEGKGGAGAEGPPQKRQVQSWGPLTRKAVSDELMDGKIESWRGSFGWIKPSKPVEGARSNLVYVAKSDVKDIHCQKEGAEVRFSIYTDQRGVGARNVQLKGDEDELPKESTQSPSANGSGKPRIKATAKSSPKATTTASQPVGKNGKGAFGKDSKAAFGKGSKGCKAANWKGAKSEHSRIASTAAASVRDRLTDEPMTGRVLEWKGSFGWIEPNEEIDKSAEYWSATGRLYVHRADLANGLSALEPGAMVQFHAFVDGKGVGAENVTVVS